MRANTRLDVKFDVDEKFKFEGLDFDDFFAGMRRCTRCILPETFPGIRFDEDGVCNYCLEYKPVNVLGEEALVKVLDGYRGKGREYDCIVPISGGRDSSFVLHQMEVWYAGFGADC